MAAFEAEHGPMSPHRRLAPSPTHKTRLFLLFPIFNLHILTHQHFPQYRAFFSRQRTRIPDPRTPPAVGITAVTAHQAESSHHHHATCSHLQFTKPTFSLYLRHHARTPRRTIFIAHSSSSPRKRHHLHLCPEKPHDHHRLFQPQGCHEEDPASLDRRSRRGNRKETAEAPSRDHGLLNPSKDPEQA